MKKSRYIQLIGLALILCGLLALLGGHLVGKNAIEKNRQALQQIQSILPPATPGVMDHYADMQMPTMQVDGRDYIALLTVPAFDVELPIRSQWSYLGANRCPSRFSGTVYDGSLIVGGSDREGQLAFLSRIQNGDTILVTDMTGARFAYRVSMIYRTDSVEAEALMEGNCDLTLFARSQYGLEYIIVRCVADVVAT